MKAKMKRRAPGNPKDSPWFSATQEMRARKIRGFTMADDTFQAIKDLAAQEGVSQSEVVEEAVTLYAKKRLK